MVAVAHGSHAEDVAIEAERSVLGALLLHPDAVADVADLQPSDFCVPKHAQLMRSIRACHAATGQTDPLSVAAELAKTPGALDQVGGHEALALLVDEVIVPDARHHAAIVLEHADRRRMERGLERVRERLQDGAPIEDVRQMMAHVGGEPRQAKPVLDVMFLSDLSELGHRQQVVDGILLEDSLNVLSGPPKAYKTTLGDALSVSIADGTDWLGRAVRKPGLVIDFALEGLMGKRSRYMAQIGAHRWLDPNDPIHRRIALIRGIPDITSVSGQDMVCRTIEHVQRVTGETMQLLKLDTLARGIAFCGLDENSTKDMSSFVAGMDRIRMRFPCVQVAIHHEGKNGQLRGNSALSGAYDLLMRSRPAGKFGATLSFPEARDIECPDDIDLIFQSQIVGVDENGQHITAMRLATASATGSEPGGSAPRHNENLVRHSLQQAHEVGLTVRELIEATGLTRTTLLDTLRRLSSELRKESERNSFRYWLQRLSPSDGRSDGQVTGSRNPSLSPQKLDEMESDGVTAPMYIGPSVTSSVTRDPTDGPSLTERRPR